MIIFLTQKVNAILVQMKLKIVINAMLIIQKKNYIVIVVWRMIFFIIF